MVELAVQCGSYHTLEAQNKSPLERCLEVNNSPNPGCCSGLNKRHMWCDPALTQNRCFQLLVTISALANLPAADTHPGLPSPLADTNSRC